MGTCRFLFVFLALCAGAAAQLTETDTFKLDGVVLNSVTGKPVPRALVDLNGSAVLTGPEGEFSFAGIHAGHVRLTASKPGFFAPGTTVRGMPASMEITAGPDAGKILVKLAPEIVIWGHISGRDEEPLEGVQVQVMGYNFMSGRRQLVPMTGTQTDEDGNYRIANLPAGRYFVRANALNAARRILGARSSKTEETYQPLYYPAAPDLDAAAPVELAAGQRFEASFSFVPVPAFRVTGTVVASADLKQVNPPMILDDNGQMLYPTERWEAPSRSFEFHVPAGSYVLRMNGRDQQDHQIYSEQTIAISQPVNGLKLALQPGVEIPVIVQRQFSKPAQDCSMSFRSPSGEEQHTNCSDLPAAHVELIGMGSTHAHFMTEYGQQDLSNYGIHNVAPGKYMVRVRANFGGYVQSAQCGAVDLLRDPLVVPPGGSVGAIEVTLRDDAATLKIAVRAEKPLDQGMIVVVPDGGLFPESRAIGGRGHGLEFQYGALAPGTYKVFAFDSAAGIDYNNPEVLAKYSASAASIRVEANDNASVAVDVIHTGD